MADLDETDLEIVALLLSDARRPWSDVAEHVGLSPPAVADRVDRLREAGVIRRFTLDLDRSQLRGGVPVLVDLDVEPGAAADVREALSGAEAVEHVFATADGDVVWTGRVPDGDVPAWMETELAATRDAVRAYEVDLLTAAEWTPGVGGTDFALTCAECGNTVTSEGETERYGGERYHFCCPSCAERFGERYDRVAEGAD